MARCIDGISTVFEFYSYAIIMPMQHVSKMFDSSRGDLFRIAQSAHVVNIAQAVFDAAYPGISHHVRVISSVDGALRVASASSVVMSDIVLRESSFLTDINARLEVPSVQRIVCLVNDPSMR